MATRKLTVQILGDSRSLERAFRSSERAGANFGRSVKTAGVLAAAGIAAFTVTAGKTVRAASNLAEQINKSSVVFGANAAAVEDWSKTTAKSFGISQRAALEAAGGFGQMLQTAGITEDASADMSKSLVELAADLASFNNIDPTVALDKLRSGLAGEAEPLRQVGVFLSEARVKAEAYASGIAKAGSKLTEGQKVQARYNLILKDTAKAQGDFARTSDSLANSTRRIGALIENASANIGRLFLPVVEGATNALADFIEEFSGAKTLSAKFDVVVENVQGLARSIATQIGNAVAKINWTAVFARAEGIAAGLQERLAEVDFSVVGTRIGEAFSDAAKVALPAASQIADRVAAAVREVDWEELGKSMGPGLAAAVTTAFVTLLDPTFWARNWDLALAVALTAFGGPIGKFVGKAAGLLVSGLAAAITRLSPALGNAVRGLALQFVRLFGAGLSVLGRVLSRTLAPLLGIVRNIFRKIGRLATFTVRVLGIQAVIDLVTELVADVRRQFSRLGGFIGDVFRDAIRKVLEFVNKVLGVTSFLGGFDPFKGLRSKIQRQLAAMEQDVEDTAGNINTTLNTIKDKDVSIVIRTTVVTAAGGAAGAGGGGRVPTLAPPGGGFEPAATAAAKSVRDADRATKALGARYNAMAAAYDRLAKEQAKAAARAQAAGAKAAKAAKAAAARAKKALERAQDAYAELMASLDLRFDIAVDRSATRKALAILAEREAAIRRQIAIEGRTTELLRDLHDVQEERANLERTIAETAAEKVQRRQFRKLGLTETGEKVLPGLANLQKQFASLTKRLDGTPLEKKYGGIMRRIGNVLRTEGKNLTDETIRWIVDMWDEIRGAFKDGGDSFQRVATRAINTKEIVRGLGLSVEEAAAIRGRLSKFTTAGRTLAPETRTTAFGAVVAAGPPITVENTIYLDGAVIGRSTKRFLQNDRIHSPAQKRGPNAGR